MQRFKKILVGVDLSLGGGGVAGDVPSPSAQAVDRALWLAKLNAARLTFFHTLDVSASAQRKIEESGGDPTVMDQARKVLQGLVERAEGEGVVAEMDVRFGKSWVEIIRQVLRRDHDLVVAGTRHLGELQGFLMGSTGIKLLRKCPCPVWITQPQPDARIKSILVAHCLRIVGDYAMELGCSMARLHGAQLHVLHSLEFPELDSPFPERISAEKAAQYRSAAERHIGSQLAIHEFEHAPQVHIVTDTPDFAVLNHIKEHGIQLLVMGTIARTGIAGMITGNTAERLLPQIPCSVLAVKPANFVTPVVA